jgi:hypothetical protein
LVVDLIVQAPVRFYALVGDSVDVRCFVAHHTFEPRPPIVVQSSPDTKSV